jgi:hypothetical protein
LSIIDDGIGFATAEGAKRTGRSIDERVRLAGATCRWSLGSGTARAARADLARSAAPFASESGGERQDQGQHPSSMGRSGWPSTPVHNPQSKIARSAENDDLQLIHATHRIW